MPTSWRQTQSESNPSRGTGKFKCSRGLAAAWRSAAGPPRPAAATARPGSGSMFGWGWSAAAWESRPGPAEVASSQLRSGGLVTVTAGTLPAAEPGSAAPEPASGPCPDRAADAKGLGRRGLKPGPGPRPSARVHCQGDAAGHVLAGPPRSRCAESSKSPLPRAESRVVTGARAAAGAGPGDRGRQCTHRA